MRDTFHHATITQKHVGIVIDDLVARLVEFRRQQLFRHRHSHCIGDTLAERAGGGFNTRRVAVFGMTRGLGMHLAETLQLIHGQIVTRQMQQRVDQHRAVSVRQHEAIAVSPLRVSRVVTQMAVPQYIGDLSHAHRRAGMTRIRLLHSIHRQHANRASDVIEFWWGDIACG